MVKETDKKSVSLASTGSNLVDIFCFTFFFLSSWEKQPNPGVGNGLHRVSYTTPRSTQRGTPGHKIDSEKSSYDRSPNHDRSRVFILFFNLYFSSYFFILPQSHCSTFQSKELARKPTSDFVSASSEHYGPRYNGPQHYKKTSIALFQFIV